MSGGDLEVTVNEIKMKSGLKIGRLTLNRPKALNALSLNMFQILKKTLLKWEKESDIVAVILDSASERAFCAGGDVKEVVRGLTDLSEEASKKSAIDFFSMEYYVDYLIRVYEKPIVCWASGVVMGGGIGLMNGCSHRVICENSILAMPEINIGFFPDVGASFFLNQLPNKVGYFMGLTAARLSGGDALAVSLGDYYIQSSQKSQVLDGLEALAWERDAPLNNQLVGNYLETFSNDSIVGQAEIMDRLEEINELMDQDTLKDLDSVMREWEPTDPYFQTCKKVYEEGSPTTVNVFYELMRKAPRDIKQIYLREFNVAMNLCLRKSDFVEGVRAVLVDKDNDPRWRPSKLSKVEGIKEIFNDIDGVDSPLSAWLAEHP